MRSTPPETLVDPDTDRLATGWPFTQSDSSAVAFTQASSVMPVVRSSEPDEGIVTQLEEPLNDSAEPNLPAVHAVFDAFPSSPRPDESCTVEPRPSSNEYDATRPTLSAPGSIGALKTLAWTLAFELFSITCSSVWR